MNQPTDAPQDAASVAPASGSAAERKPAAAGKPRFALFIATACGLGYMPKAPGTWGSVLALPIYCVVYSYYYFFFFPTDVYITAHDYVMRATYAASTTLAISLFIAGIGVWAADRAATFSGTKDPQFVVVDEVSGQHLALLLGSVLPTRWSISTAHWPGYPLSLHS
ncbi:MAG: phosphatidylglycerophosphatase A, partial [Candidatus Acidiferrales bacterium]